MSPSECHEYKKRNFGRTESSAEAKPEAKKEQADLKTESSAEAKPEAKKGAKATK